MAELAKHIKVTSTRDGHSLTINGEEFPWLLAAAAIRDLAAGWRALRPRSWRRELFYWALTYALTAVLFGLPPL